MISSSRPLSRQILRISAGGEVDTAPDSVITIDIDPRGEQARTN
jgi:hypothetical protein